MCKRYSHTMNLVGTRNTNCSAGQGRANDTLDVVGSYYDLADPEEAWDNLPQSFSCRPYGCE